ncbi:putative nucleoside triphosphate hydrolase [Vibrio nigripulchritudo SFn27]|uniref:Putative nucleoside triphosphate hydrolase n=1 Tax=Vibrio nigripulchritudo TaxID=28173 RepID=U4JVY0_9VIBR|nr:zinc ribbon domain-containing protein [Vibrio nigripulchritudo]CCN83488.1 putative nucleoside triphosphate hydrolase [Vibrio nigripulchritudo BLFn1]CCN90974.1 putative nucleoside triphosphate hydrolase [Vibrio nigripulchritudo SFn27]CCN95200.1 putative nucleoside triphosphate hydrolase [Vibrio nigripulchritudo ENn2]CCO42320.1 putative nucleoside triphosphate hydrolase [Vibrio nigripulchritudo SFn135]CCO52215.1 putative nucleoside triphosphate hydrolase [Vibrio nigripulchritudo Wn13]
MADQIEIDLSFFDSSEYEERADYLTNEQLLDWTANSEHFQHIQKKLIQVGAKLITGPRGTGKTHQMRCAYNTCIDNDRLPLPIYVTFNHYLRLETYLHSKSNALDIFHAWVLCKISYDVIDKFDVEYNKDCLSKNNLLNFVKDMERNIYNIDYDEIISTINISLTQGLIYRALEKKGRKRAILLLDDAALTLTRDYMVEFFDIFRSIKSIKISPKASVYPGTTQYGPRFHVGQDAEQVSIWMDVQDKDYIPFMNTIIDKRFREHVNIDDKVLNLLMFASFGIPRAYISLIRSYVDSDRNKTQQQRINSVIQSRCDNITQEYLSIAEKIRQYGSFVNVGHKFLFSLISSVKEFNYDNYERKGDDYRKNIIIGIEDLDEKAERMVKFLVEAGLLFEMSMVSHGQERKLRRFVPHLALLIKEKALIKSRGLNVAQLVTVLSNPSEKHPIRRKFNRIISEDVIAEIKIDLPACTDCGTARIADGQKFCHICGSELVDCSIFKECMTKELSELPFTEFQHKVIRISKFKTIEDVLISDDTIRELKKVKQVGPKYAEKIVNKINAWTNEFLY